MKQYAVIHIVWFTTLLLFICFPATAQTIEGCTAADCHAAIVVPVNIHPAIEDDCNSCHEESGGEHPSGSGKDITLIDEVPALCYMCHDEKNIEAVVHPPVEAGDCLDCHSPHSSDSEYLLLQNSVKETCNQCHDISDQKGIFHSPVEEGLCTNCHNPHQSKFKNLLNEQSPVICFTCHNDLEPDESLISIHPPFEEDCSNCHKPHSSEFSFLVNDSFPTGNYASGFEGNYNLCFTCHDEAAFTVELTNEATDFRDGSTNLHFVHVNKDKSRSCTNCHDVHGSKNEHLILEKLTFGSWQMELKYKGTDSGGSCYPGCHSGKSYSR